MLLATAAPMRRTGERFSGRFLHSISSIMTNSKRSPDMRINGCKHLARAITNERIIQMDDVYGCDETVVNGSDPTILDYGDYLLIEHETNTRYIYRRAADDAPLHPLVSRIRHGGIIYALEWIEEED
jgi:hypothetical protein